MKIAIIGAGAMGAMFGAKLQLSGNDVCLIDVWKDQVDAINNPGLLLRTKGDEGKVVKMRAVTSADQVGGIVELAIVFVKGVYTETAIEAAKCIIGPDTYVLTLQNGVGNADIVAKHVDPDRVIMGTTTGSATILKAGEVDDTTEVAPGHYTVHITSITHNNTPRVHEIADILTKATISSEVSESAEFSIWQKLAVNCCVNAPCVVTRVDCGVFSNNQFGEWLQTRIIQEVCEVAQHKGIPLYYEATHNMIRGIFRTSTHHPSMAQDAYKKARTEIETITGAVVREGKKLNIPTPVNETLYNLVKIVEENYDKLWY